MKFSEDILEKLNVEIEEERLPVHIMQVREMLMQFKESAERIVFKSKLCANTQLFLCGRKKRHIMEERRLGTA